ncbi:MAG: DUF2723 domain-containing protein [Bacteroidales bacterium]|nr:DUF2723 domain-containing protein [Bacteroidales bacterium]
MNSRKFRQWNLLTAAVVFLISVFTYLSTIEPTASFWDCGEFIASSFKIEVGHPPGNPVFQLIARFFTMFTGASKAAVMVNCLSALCAALTNVFLYLTIVFLAKRLITTNRREDGGSGEYTAADALAIFGSGAVGALANCFSDTFWFSAVEGEVYAMSSLFTAMVVWAMAKWYEAEDRRYANRWIVLISFLMGLSIGVHVLNLLALPMIVFMYYYKTREDQPFTFWECVKILLLSAALIGGMFFVMIPWIPKLAAYFDLFFVNVMGLPYNTGATFFMLALLGACFWGLFRTLSKGKVFWNTALLCVTTILIGFSIFSVVVIRSHAKTPTNEYQPDNAFTLVRYLSREQYGSVPLVYGQYFGAPYTLKQGTYWAPLNGKYKKVASPVEPVYDPAGKMIFPRMYSNDDKSIKFYQQYMNGKGRTVPGADYKKPTFGTNIFYFLDFQMGWMYWRYFMWNFVGRQNEIHAPTADLFTGNWESGIKAIDNMRLGDQGNAPEWLKENKGKNHLFFLPLLLGILGLLFQFDKDKRGCWLTFLLFFMTGIAVVMYLNQPPFQVRERDYAYAGSFYAFTIWIGLAVAALYSWISIAVKGKGRLAVSALVTLACLGVPALMCAQEWDDHDRSNRFTSVEVAYNYLNSTGRNGILVTHGDNDTFPLWYAQEVEGIRNDVRICNTSLLGTDWYIDQMRYAINNAGPLDLSIGQEQYLYGTNDWVVIQDTREQPVNISDCVMVFKHPDAKVITADGRKLDYWMSRKMIIPVNKENCLKYGIVSPKFADRIPDSITLEIPADKSGLTKPELFMLDLLSNYKWDRPINLLNQGGDLNIGLKDYLMYDGFSYRFTPIKNKVTTFDLGLVDTDELYTKLTETFKFDAVSADNYLIDYQNMYTFMGVMSLRNLFVSSASAFLKAGEYERAEETLDKCREVMRPDRYPLDNSLLGWASNALYPIEMVRYYYALEKPEKAREVALELDGQLKESIALYLDFYPEYKDDLEYNCQLIYYMTSEIKKLGDESFAEELESDIADFLNANA